MPVHHPGVTRRTVHRITVRHRAEGILAQREDIRRSNRRA
jgi:hypothetical protein